MMDGILSLKMRYVCYIWNSTGHVYLTTEHQVISLNERHKKQK
jgi:hypothetical protein